MIIKPLGISATCNTTSASSFANSTLVRVSHFDSGNTAHTVFCHYANATLRYSIVIIGSESIILEKGATDTINCSSTDATVRAVAVAYKN